MTESIYKVCPLKCGFQAKADIGNKHGGFEFAKVSLKSQMNLHLPNCPNNTNKEKDEVTEHIDELRDKMDGNTKDK